MTLCVFLTVCCSNFKNKSALLSIHNTFTIVIKLFFSLNIDIYFSDLREAYGWLKGDSAADRAADQEANKHGRNGGDPNEYRPNGLPDKYKR
jgi:hypothetical protein